MIELTQETFEQEVLKSDIPVFVDFYADWCGPCKAAAPVVEGIEAQYEGKVKFAKLNVDNAGSLVAALKITGIPNFMIFKGNTVTDQFVGFRPGFEEQIVEALNKLIAS